MPTSYNPKIINMRDAANIPFMSFELEGVLGFLLIIHLLPLLLCWLGG